MQDRSFLSKYIVKQKEKVKLGVKQNNYETTTIIKRSKRNL